jgi:serine/threonine protein kinase
VAVKFLTNSASNTDREKEKRAFLMEIDLMRRLRHPNIVVLYGIAQDATRGLMLVAEFMNDGSLLTFVHNNFPLLSNMTLLKMCLDIVSAMEHLQRCGVVHRDLAARNVLVRKGKGDEVLCKLSDFGLGQYIEDNGYFVADRLNPLPLKWSAPESLLRKKWGSARLRISALTWILCRSYSTRTIDIHSD